MPSLKDFTDAMSASWPVALAIFLGSMLALLFDYAGVSYAVDLPRWLLGVAFVLALFSGAILIVAVVRGLYTLAMKPFRKRKAEEWKRDHIAGLNNLPPQEVHVLAWMLANNTQVFLEEVNHELLEPLIIKGYVRAASGTHSILKWPYSIPDHVWKALLSDRDKLPPLDQMRNPFDRW